MSPYREPRERPKRRVNWEYVIRAGVTAGILGYLVLLGTTCAIGGPNAALNVLCGTIGLGLCAVFMGCIYELVTVCVLPWLREAGRFWKYDDQE